MKAYLPVLAAVTAILAGCGARNSGNTTPSTNATAGSTNRIGLATVPVDYLSTIVQAQKSADKTIDVSYLNEAVQQFNVQEGRYPKDLQELVPNYVGKLPTPPFGSKLDYNANSGTVKVVSQ